MIASLSISDFQAHQLSQFEFSPGINTIVGTSDHGKSAVLRSLYWTLWNRPSGLGIIRRGTKSCTVTLVYTAKDKKHTVRRTRSSTVNEYVVDGSPFRAVGRGVPDELSKVIPLREINVQRQFDAPFLIFDTPGVVADTLNRFTGLHLAAKVVDKLGDNVSVIQRRITTWEQDRVQVQQQLTSLEWVTGYEKVVLDWEKVDGACVAVGGDIAALDTLIARMERLHVQRKQVMASLANKQDWVQRAVAKKDELQTEDLLVRAGAPRRLLLNTLTDRLVTMTQRWRESRAALKAATPIATSRRAQLDRALAAREQCREAIIACDAAAVAVRRMQHRISQMRTAEIAASRKQVELVTAQTALKKCMAEFSAGLVNCPYCEQELTVKAKKALSTRLLGGSK